MDVGASADKEEDDEKERLEVEDSSLDDCELYWTYKCVRRQDIPSSEEVCVSYRSMTSVMLLLKCLEDEVVTS